MDPIVRAGEPVSANVSEKPKSRAAQLLERASLFYICTLTFKIREKERKKLLAQGPVEDANVVKKRAMARRLPEMAQSIKLFYSKENKSVLSFYKVAKHVASSMQKNPMSEGN